LFRSTGQITIGFEGPDIQNKAQTASGPAGPKVEGNLVIKGWAFVPFSVAVTQ